MEKSDVLVLSVITLMVAAALGAGAWHFWIDKDYPFVVEAACDPSVETCFYRDCSVADDCPPNGFENYSVYTVIAEDFGKCSDNSCAIECKRGTITCEKLKCGETEGDECAVWIEEVIEVPAEETTEEPLNE